MLTFRQTHCPYTRQPDRTIGGYDASHFYINVSWGFASNCFLKIYNKTNDSLLATLPLEGLNDVWTTPTMFSTTMAQKISYQGNEFTFSSQYLMNSHDVTYVYSDSTWHYGDSSKNWRSGSCSAWIKIDDAPDQTLTNNNDFLTNKYYSNFHQTNAIYNT
jgi:hypothetical protein